MSLAEPPLSDPVPDDLGSGAPAKADPRGAAGTPEGAAAIHDLTGQLLDARYEIVQKVGEGGMCWVYLARDTHSGDKVAIKVLLPTLLDDPIAMARLRREAALGSQLRHPNVCHNIRHGVTANGADYIVMPFVEGELLCDRTREAGHLSLEATARFVRDICAGLHVAHEVGIIHRDLKPENVMIVAAPDGSERAVVMDFSLAKGPDAAPLTAVGLVVGTPEFMSPEQLRGNDLDRRSDIYSLAFMVYEMLTGELPFEGRTQQEIMIARLRGDAIPISKRRPDLTLPPGVERVLAKALAPNAKHRYATAREFGQAFTRAAAGEDPERGAGLGGIFGRLLGFGNNS